MHWAIYVDDAAAYARGYVMGCDAITKQASCLSETEEMAATGQDRMNITREEARDLRIGVATARSQAFGLPELKGGSLRMRQGMLLERDQLYAEYERWQQSAWRYRLSERQWTLVEWLINRIFSTPDARWYLQHSDKTLLELLSERLWWELCSEKRIEVVDEPDDETPAPPSDKVPVKTDGDGVSADAANALSSAEQSATLSEAA